MIIIAVEAIRDLILLEARFFGTERVEAFIRLWREVVQQGGYLADFVKRWEDQEGETITPGLASVRANAIRKQGIDARLPPFPRGSLTRHADPEVAAKARFKREASAAATLDKVLQTYADNNGNVDDVALELGVDRKTVLNKMVTIKKLWPQRYKKAMADVGIDVDTDEEGQVEIRRGAPRGRRLGTISPQEFRRVWNAHDDKGEAFRALAEEFHEVVTTDPELKKLKKMLEDALDDPDVTDEQLEPLVAKIKAAQFIHDRRLYTRLKAIKARIDKDFPPGFLKQMQDRRSTAYKMGVKAATQPEELGDEDFSDVEFDEEPDIASDEDLPPPPEEAPSEDEAGEFDEEPPEEGYPDEDLPHPDEEVAPEDEEEPEIVPTPKSRASTSPKEKEAKFSDVEQLVIAMVNNSDSLKDAARKLKKIGFDEPGDLETLKGIVKRLKERGAKIKKS